jgi:predicted DNA-binding transcriptional regulator AlpA
LVKEGGKMMGHTLRFGGDLAILSTGQVLDILKISKAGLYKWIKSGKVVVREFKWGGRTFKGFKDTEIEELAKRMKKVREPGLPLLEDKKKGRK